MRTSRADKLIAALVFAVSLAALMAGSRTQGNVRDEGYYFDAAESYSQWYVDLFRHPRQTLSPSGVARAFSYNSEHPGLMKSLFGLSARLFSRTLHVLDEEQAMRLPTHVLSAAMIAVVFLFGVGIFRSRRAGLVAAGLTLCAPRLFFDAQLACFDAPIAAFWVFCVYGWWRSLDVADENRWGWRTAVLFGMALATKHNAFFLPVLFVIHWLWIERDRLMAFKAPRFPVLLAWGLLLSPTVYLVCWPWLGYDTVGRFSRYVAFHVNHVHYNMEFLGINYNKPPAPLSYPYVMTALTLPVTTLVLAIGGTAVWLRNRDGDPRGSGFLLLLNAIFPMAILTVTRAPIFGATKHWHASIPFLALLAAAGYDQLVRWLPEMRRGLISSSLAVIFVLPAALETRRSHPYALSHYNLLAGGPAGGADLGMNRQFWGYATRGLMPWLNQNAPRNARIYWHDTNQSQLNMAGKAGYLRRDLVNSNTPLEEPGVKASNIAMVILEKHFSKYEYWIWDFYGTARPTQVLSYEGVPLVPLYVRPKP